jgi:hypothetical protein
VKRCVYCSHPPYYVKWDDVPGYTLWAVDCTMHCWMTDFYYTKKEARKEWKGHKRGD